MAMRSFALGPTMLTALLLIGCASSTQDVATLSTDVCVRRAKNALRDADFDQDRSIVDEAGNRTVFGDHASYRAQVHCPAVRGPVGLTVTGPDNEQSAWYKDTIVRKF
jgi:outer membrane murein-binding lipoprotein Lpp